MVIYMNKSIWNDYSKKNIKYNNKLDDKHECDILIIGGGITGLTTAYFLKDMNEKIILIDKNEIGSGITNRTTAKISYLQGNIYQTLMNYFGKSKAYEYYNSQIDGINLIRKIVNDNKIDCDFKKCDSVLFTLCDNAVKKIEKEYDLLSEFGAKVNFIKHKKIKKGIKVSDTYTFNPLKYLYKLSEIVSKKIEIYENVMANDIDFVDNHYVVHTNEGDIICKRIVVVCHYPFFLIPGMFPIKTYIKREYVNASKVDDGKDYTAINIDKDLHSIRFYKDYLIYGSNQHRLTNKIDYADNYMISKENFKKYFGLDSEYTWSNHDIVSNDELPFIGEVRKNLFVSLGYNAWGMSNGTIGAKIISDLIINDDSKYKNLFNPKRINLIMIGNSLIGSFHYLKGYVEGLFKKNNPEYVKIDKMWYGIYTDKEKKKHIVKLICPHMKCPLVFNIFDLTWDCPCHGSRFDIDGNVITGPSSKSICKCDNEKS